MKDFTLDVYKYLLSNLLEKGYLFYTFEQYLALKNNNDSEKNLKFVILRHDVDLKAENSLETAKIEAELGISATYYFRIVPQSNKPSIIKEIAALGHEVGYHYEDLSLFKGDEEIALEHFKEKLQYFRQYYPVKTICMHGSPRTKYDNRNLWKKYKYQDYGIIGEPYFDVDFNKVLYLTDTGRTWDNKKYNIRDKVQTNYDFHFKSTDDIIKAIQSGILPNHIMITTHPQRWTNNIFFWFSELFLQSFKNKIKQLIVKV